jgi:hypothetical protein
MKCRAFIFSQILFKLAFLIPNSGYVKLYLVVFSSLLFFTPFEKGGRERILDRCKL